MKKMKFLNKTEYDLLTDITILIEWLVVETVNLINTSQIWMQNHQAPLTVVIYIVQICNGDFHSPVFFVTYFHMPMHFYWAHVMCTLYCRLQQGILMLLLLLLFMQHIRQIIQSTVFVFFAHYKYRIYRYNSDLTQTLLAEVSEKRGTNFTLHIFVQVVLSKNSCIWGMEQQFRCRKQIKKHSKLEYSMLETERKNM